LILFLPAGGSLFINSLMDIQRSRRVGLPGLNVCTWAALLTIQAAAQEIAWSIPEDGGTPRNTNRVERIGPGEFRVRASEDQTNDWALLVRRTMPP